MCLCVCVCARGPDSGGGGGGGLGCIPERTPLRVRVTSARCCRPATRTRSVLAALAARSVETLSQPHTCQLLAGLRNLLGACVDQLETTTQQSTPVYDKVLCNTHTHTHTRACAQIYTCTPKRVYGFACVYLYVYARVARSLRVGLGAVPEVLGVEHTVI